MDKKAKADMELIEEKLEYIGLDLKKIPIFLNKFEALNFRPVQSYDEKTYKVYKYIDMQDIQILITPMDRLAELKEKYRQATPLFTYLDEKNEKNIERFTTFLRMLKDLKIENIEEIEKEQNVLKGKIPTKIKYNNNFIWQIYYSDVTNRYFMLVPAEEQDQSAMFYLIKKQIEIRKNRRKSSIFVPISQMEYSGKYLSKTEIGDLENYLWYFTKDWVSIYEVFDKKNNMSIKIVGNVNVYEKIKSEYVISLDTKQKAINFYKLLKAMFILATGAPTEYNFKVKISDDSKLNFFYGENIIEYSKMSEFISIQYKEKIEKLKDATKENSILEERLGKLKKSIEELTEDYLVRQKQIATFLECKKTFFGRVKYFFKKKKDVQVEKKIEKTERHNKKEKEKLEDLYEEKKQYNIEDLINICNKLKDEEKKNTNLNLDINALDTKRDVLNKKIDNADLYIKEIDKHKKSIFEFWKFTSKDEIQTLNEGEEEKKNENNIIEKYFDYEEDFENLGKEIDELQRRKLSKNETDGIFAAKQVVDSFKVLYKNNDSSVKNGKDLNKILEKDLKNLKENYKNDIEYINIKDFDIFGGLSEDKTKIKVINNEKHREVEKDKYKVLNVNTETSLEEYKQTLEDYLRLVKEAICKISAPYNMSVYKVSDKEEINGIDIFDINPENALKEALKSKNKEIALYRVNIKENMPIIYYTNIIFYDNLNKTLPVGMNLSTEVLVDTDKFNKNLVKQEEFNINCEINEFETIIKKIKVYEYETDYIEKEKKNDK